MKALVYEGKERLVYRDADMPTPRPGENLVQIHAVGICGSDMHAYLGHDDRRPAPLILGHEAAGIVKEGNWAGKRVTINPLVSCRTCTFCKSGRENICADRQIISMPPREGAFAQYVAIPDENLVAVPDGFSLEKAALCEPIAVSWHAVKLALNALHPSMERSAIVLGGGAIGLAAVLALKANGVDQIEVIELNEVRKDFLRNNLGLSVNSQVKDHASIVIDAVGIGATRSVASTWVKQGGVISHVGLGDSLEGLDIRRITLQEVTLMGSYTYTAEDFRETAQAMFDGRLGALDWFVKRPLAEGAGAFRDFQAGSIAEPKVILIPIE